MTRLLYLLDDVTVIQLEVEIPASQLCAAVNAGMRPVKALRDAPAGKMTASVVGKTVVVAPFDKSGNSSQPAGQMQGLSRRQAQVHELAARGLTSGEIAVMLRLSRRTVNYHLNQAKNRLRVGGVAQTKIPPLRLIFDADE